MTMATVDASVWIAAQDLADPFCVQSRLFFSHTVAAGILIHVPAFARVEVACALARKLRNSVQAERLANLILKTANAKEHPVSAALLAKAVSVGTTKFLRGADAMYSATADLVGCELVSLDKEHLQRAEALTPDDWLLANP
ncbi:MAG: PIN domain-containing protein [Verrucomicrobia bacterium]|nr:MAG: PIN domain-containing protein [Verrucomicrobiota bacterium]